MPKIKFDCADCLAFCCSIYERVHVTDSDLKRLAAYSNKSTEEAAKFFTKIKNRILNIIMEFLTSITAYGNCLTFRKRIALEMPCINGNDTITTESARVFFVNNYRSTEVRKGMRRTFHRLR